MFEVLEKSWTAREELFSGLTIELKNDRLEVRVDSEIWKKLGNF